MQKLNSNIQEISKKLKSLIGGNVIDIIIIGSSVKDKLVPGDFDLVVLFKEKKLSEVEDLFFKIKEKSNLNEIHIEPLFTESMFKESLFLTTLHEGFSIKENKFINEAMKLKSYSLFSFNLMNLSKLEKVKFAQALYGRKKDGLLHMQNGVSLGNGSLMVPVYNEEIFKEFFSKWKVKFIRKRAFVSD